MDGMLQTLLDYLMYVGVLRMIIFVATIIAAFEYLFQRVQLFNPGTLTGIGVAGLIGVIGFVSERLDWVSGIATCLLGGFIGSGLYRRAEEERNRANEESIFAILDRLARAIE